MKKSGPLVIALWGGLGNQLFQYATGLALSEESGRPLHIAYAQKDVSLDRFVDLDAYDRADDRLLRIFGLDRMTSTSVLASARRRVRSIRLQRSRKYVTICPMTAFSERNDEDVRSPASAILLRGCFQHPSWFEPGLVTVVSELARSLADVIPELADQHATVISFRRGDYVRTGWTLPFEYYQRALANLEPSDGPVWVTSDDPLMTTFAQSWLREAGVDVAPIPPLPCGHRLRDLAILAAADRVVMSNSTFCWWGVVVGDVVRGDAVQRHIIAPAHWIDEFPQSPVLIRRGWTAV